MKKLLVGLIALTLAIPSMAWAGGYATPSPEQLLQKIEQLNQQLEQVKAQLKEVKAAQESQGEDLSDTSDKLDNLLTDGIGRFKVWGDYRFRVDSTRLHVPHYWGAGTLTSALSDMSSFNSAQLGSALGGMLPALSPELQAQFGQVVAGWDNMDTTQRVQTLNQMLPSLSPGLRTAMLQSLGYGYSGNYNAKNNTIYTNRVRLNASVKPSDNLIFKARLAAYKIWGQETDYVSAGGGVFPANLMVNNMTAGVRPSDSQIYLDRAYVNWTNIGGLPIWFSVGRRPTTHTVPTQLREGLDKREAGPLGLNIDIPFDGGTIGYQYANLFGMDVPGRIRFCYGRGYESGFSRLGQSANLKDTDFGGFVWDVADMPDQNLFIGLQAFMAANIFDFPEGKIYMQDPSFPFGGQDVYMTSQTNLGDIYEIGALVQHQIKGIDWFASAAWSISDPKHPSKGLEPGFQNNPIVDPFEGVSILTNPGQSLDTHTGWAVYAGTRIPFESLNSKLGIEYNYGSKYWMPFNVGVDDLYMDKLATRGHVGEIYWIWDLPEAPWSKYAKAFIRAGYQYYWFNYTGSGNWLGAPMKIDDLKDDPMNAQLFTPIDRMDNAYVTFEVYF